MDGSIRQVTFRVQHDCPVARLSRAVDGTLQAWSGHRFEVVAFQGKASGFEAFEAAARAELDPIRIERTERGGLAVWRPRADPNGSISRIIERHDLMWQQPLRIKDGWEHYDAISFGGSEKQALDELRAHHTTTVVRRRTVAPDDVLSSLFLSLQPTLESPTDKQVEALVTAHRLGYYRSPRAVTTSDVAAALGIGRSALEERLRGAENRVMEELGPAMAYQRRVAK